MIREIDYKVTCEEAGLTVGRLLINKGYSKKLITALRHDEYGLTINGNNVFTIYELNAGDVLHVRLSERKPSEHVIPIEPQIPLQVMYEDEDILVVDKAAGVPVHPSLGHYEDTLGNAVAWYLREHGDITFHIINRLDKDTSGLTIVAKNRLSAGILSEAMVRREIHRTYLALCDGLVPDNGTIDSPIARKEGSILERVVDYKNGETAITHYERLNYDAAHDVSLVKLWLETGRTHQIRVHMKHIGHPLLGDFLYNPEDTRMDRQALHSFSLRFRHPITDEELYFESEIKWNNFDFER